MRTLLLIVILAGIVTMVSATGDPCRGPITRCEDGVCHYELSMELDGGPPGCMPWNERDIKPGFHECSRVYFKNDGHMDATLYILIRNINGDYDLGKYLFFNVQGDGLETDITLPATVYDFPDEIGSLHYIRIPDFNVGDIIYVDWCWEFIETNAPQNEAQGKSLGFDVYYVLVAPELPPDCQKDDDNDGVVNCEDLCPGTTDWFAGIHLNPNHYDSSNLDPRNTRGCSCYQILSCKPGNTDGEYKYGCTEGTLDVWNEQQPGTWTTNCEPAQGYRFWFFDWWKHIQDILGGKFGFH